MENQLFSFIHQNGPKFFVTVQNARDKRDAGDAAKWYADKWCLDLHGRHLVVDASKKSA